MGMFLIQEGSNDTFANTEKHHVGSFLPIPIRCLRGAKLGVDVDADEMRREVNDVFASHSLSHQRRRELGLKIELERVQMDS